MQPYVAMNSRKSHYDVPFSNPDDLHRALSGYRGVVSFLDEQISKIMTALAVAGLSDAIRVACTSDHGDNLGARGLWDNATMHDESAAIPMLVVGTDVPVGGRWAAPAEDRAALSDFHIYGPDGLTMSRGLTHNYVRCINAPPQLFDLQADPEELHDLGASNAAAGISAAMEPRLRGLVASEAADAAAEADQAAMIEKHGGEAALRKRAPAAFTPPPAMVRH